MKRETRKPAAAATRRIPEFGSRAWWRDLDARSPPLQMPADINAPTEAEKAALVRWARWRLEEYMRARRERWPGMRFTAKGPSEDNLLAQERKRLRAEKKTRTGPDGTGT